MKKNETVPVLYSLTLQTLRIKKKNDNRIYIKVKRWNTSKYIPSGYYKIINLLV
jgi:hypothetical protein